MNWTGTQWSVGFTIPVTIGLITAGDVVFRSVTDARFVRTLPDARDISVSARWHVQAPADFPVLIYADLVDATTGEVELQLQNTLTVDTDFADRDCYFELSPPFYAP